MLRLIVTLCIIGAASVPANDVGNTFGDRRKQSLKCSALRVTIIDEVCMMSAELLGTLARVVSTAVRVTGSHKITMNAQLDLLRSECHNVFGLLAVAHCNQKIYWHRTRLMIHSDVHTDLWTRVGRVEGEI